MLQLSYLDTGGAPSLAGVGETPAAETGRSDRADDSIPAPDRIRSRRAQHAAPGEEDVVRIGGSVTVDSDETVRGDVVVIGGSATIDGEVDGDVVVVGGSARLGPQADVRGDVRSSAAESSRDPRAVIRGGVQEVGIRRIRGPGLEGAATGELGLDGRRSILSRA